MRTRILVLDPDGEPGDLIRRAAAVLDTGGLMVYPTETFYGLGAAATCEAAVAKVRSLKGREGGKPLPLIAADEAMVRTWIRRPPPPAFEALAASFWPGPLTLVLPASSAVPAFIRGPGDTIGIRVPPLDWLRRLVGMLGAPITSTSANVTGESELDDPAAVAGLFRDRVDLVIDGGRTPGGRPSTVLDLSTEPPRILRAGAVPEAAIRDRLEAARD